MKKLFILMMCSLSFSCFAMSSPVDLQHFLAPATYAKACGQALATTAPGFCASFKDIAKCQCEQRSPRKDICNDMNIVYNTMIGAFGNLDRACAYQVGKDGGTDKQTCIDDWNCYRSGGKDSHGGLCSSTGAHC
jgi:hypothetical protein